MLVYMHSQKRRDSIAAYFSWKQKGMFKEREKVKQKLHPEKKKMRDQKQKESKVM